MNAPITATQKLAARMLEGAQAWRLYAGNVFAMEREILHFRSGLSDGSNRLFCLGRDVVGLLSRYRTIRRHVAAGLWLPAGRQ